MKISYNWLGKLVKLTLNPKELAERLTMAGLAVEAVERIGGDSRFRFDFESSRCAFASRHVSHSASVSSTLSPVLRVGCPAFCNRIGAPLDSRQLRSISAKDDRR
jgi:hypothetical protein